MGARIGFGVSEAVMALGYYFAPAAMSTGQYDEVMARLAAAGMGAPAGRSYHCAFTAGPNVHVFDVWETPEAFEAFAAVLMPILGDLGVDPGQPQATEIHNVIVG